VSASPPAHPDVEILSVGMVTPIGSTAAQTAASVRAGISRMSESFIDDQFGEAIMFGSVNEEDLPPLCDALEEADLPPERRRLLRIASPAFLEALGALRDPVPLFVGAPEPRPNGEPVIDLDFLGQIATQTERAVDLARSRVVPRGRAAGLLVLEQAAAILARGAAPCILVAGVDSYLDEDTLATLDGDGRLKNGEVQDGFIPGEGAAFLLLGQAGTGARLGMTPLARIVGVGLGQEPGHLYSSEPYRGEGLAQAFSSVLVNGAQKPRVRTLYAGLNGENFWAKELGVARIRHKEFFEEPVRVEHPADAFGDAGAALGPAMVGLAAHALHYGYRTGPSLIYCGSDREERVAVLLAR
jgi:3-oxoacyl-[acyl-carrier-protein] synthase-1